MNKLAAHAPYSVPGLKAHPETLYVITCINNPGRYLSRYRHYREFAHHMECSGVNLYTIEAAFGDREFEITNRNNPNHIQVRGDELTEIWLKENLMNTALRRLPPEAKYVAFIDADLSFARPNWAEETLHKLQHHEVVQMYSSITYLNRDGEDLNTLDSFMHAWKTNKKLRTVSGMATQEIVQCNKPNYPLKGGFGQPGACWAWRRSALDKVGGLIDISILGSADYQMASALIGHAGIALAKDYSPGYKKFVMDWQSRCERHIRRNVGFVPGLVLHHWHGSMKNRGYDWRWKILTEYQYDPTTDITLDSQGLLRLHDDGSERFMSMRDSIKAYFNQRNEDE